MKYEAQLKTWALEKAIALTIANWNAPANDASLAALADKLYAYAYSPDLDLLDSFKHSLELLAQVGNATEIIKEMAFLLEQAQVQLGVSVVSFAPVVAPVEEKLND